MLGCVEWDAAEMHVAEWDAVEMHGVDGGSVPTGGKRGREAWATSVTSLRLDAIKHGWASITACQDLRQSLPWI